MNYRDNDNYFLRASHRLRKSLSKKWILQYELSSEKRVSTLSSSRIFYQASSGLYFNDKNFSSTLRSYFWHDTLSGSTVTGELRLRYQFILNKQRCLLFCTISTTVFLRFVSFRHKFYQFNMATSY